MGFLDFIEDVVDLVVDNAKNIAMFVGAALVTAAGIAVTVMAAPIIGAVVGGALIGAGVAGMMSSLSKEMTWKEFGWNMFKGGVIGAVSGLFSFGASTLIAKAGLTGVWNLAVSCAVRFGTAIGSSYVTNGINNMFDGKGFNENWKSALKVGAIIGAVGCGAEAFRFFSSKIASVNAGNLLNKTFEKVSMLKDKFNQLVNGHWLAYSAAELVKSIAEGATMQFFLTGKIDWKAVLIGTAVCLGTRLARSAYDYRKQGKQQNHKAIKEAYDDHEKKQDQNVKEAQEIAEGEAQKRVKTAQDELNNATDPKIQEEKQHVLDNAKQELKDIQDGKTLDPKTHKLTCSATVLDPEGNTHNGRSSGQREHDASMSQRKWENTNKENIAIEQEKVNEANKAYQEAPPESRAQRAEDLKNAELNLANAKTNPNQSKYDQAHQPNPHREEDMKRRYEADKPDRAAEQKQWEETNKDNIERAKGKVGEAKKAFNQADTAQKAQAKETWKQAEEHLKTEKTNPTKAVKPPSRVGMTEAEAKKKWPAGSTKDYKARDKSCSEVEAIRRADETRQGKTDLKKSSVITIGSKHDVDKNGMVTGSKHPPCKEACSSIDFGKNFSTGKNLAEQLEYAHLGGEQTVMDIRLNKEEEEKKETTATSAKVSSVGKPLLKKKNNSPVLEDSLSDGEEDWNRRTACKKTGKLKLFTKSDEPLETLEDELRWLSELKRKHEKKKEEEERLKNDDFIRNNIIRQENIYATSSIGGEGVRAGTSRGTVLDEAYPAGQFFSKKKKAVKDVKEEKRGLLSNFKGEKKEKKRSKAKKPIVEIFPIVAWSEKHNKYMMVDHNRWPNPIEGKTKMVAFLGVHKSGRTTLLHSLIYKAGYTMTKEQSLITKLGMEMQTKITIAKEISENEDRAPLSDSERFASLTEEDALLGAKHHTTVKPIRFFQPTRSEVEDEWYKRELERFFEIVTEETAAHPSSMRIEEMDETTVYGCMITTWNRIVENKEINDCVVEVSNENMMERTRGEDNRESAIEIYLKKFENYLKKIPTGTSLAEAIERYEEERRRCSREYEKTPANERDPDTFMRLLLKSGIILIEECLKMTDFQLKEEGLRIGLSVFSTLLGQGNKMMDFRILRLAVIELGLLEFIKKEIIHMFYYEAWVIFYFMAHTGFRFHLLEVPLWKALEEIITRKDELTPEKMKIYEWSLPSLMEMMDLDEMPMLQPEKNGGRLDDEKIFLTSEQRLRLDYDYRLYSEEHVRRLFDDTIIHPDKASDNYEEMIKLAENFYNGHEISKEVSFKDLHLSCKNQFAHVTLNHFHKQCAGHFARKMFDKQIMDAMKQNATEEKTVTLRLQVLRTAVGVVSKDEKLAPLLMCSGLHDWIRATFLTDARCPFIIYCYAASVASQILFVQSFFKLDKLPKEPVNREKIHTMEEIKARNRIEEMAKFYGPYRLQLLEAGCHRVAVEQLQSFFHNGQQENNLPKATMLINFIIKLIIIALDEEDRRNFVDLFIVQKRESLIVQMDLLVEMCANRVDFDKSEKMDGNLKAIESAVELVSRLMHAYYGNSFENFFGESKIWKRVTSILKNAIEKVIQPSQAVPNPLKMPEKVETSLQSFLLEFVCLSLNVSTVSGIPFTTIGHKLGKRVGTLSMLNEENPRKTGSRPEILLSMEHLAKLELNKLGYDVYNVQRAAYILNHSQFKDLVGKMVKTAKERKTVKEENNRRLEMATARRKRLEALETRQPACSGPSYADRMKDGERIGPSTSSASFEQNVMACDGIFMKTSLLKDFALPRKNWADLLFAKLVDVFDFTDAYGYMLLLTNRTDESRRKLEEFLEYLKSLLESEDPSGVLELKEPLISLSWIEALLSHLDYCHVKGDSEEAWFVSPGPMTKERNDIYNLLKEYLPRQKEISLKLDTTFREVTGNGSEAMFGELILPEDFFSSQKTESLKILTTKKIKDLIKDKKKYQPWLDEEKHTYTLVRVEVTATSKVYQAVFNRYMSISSVLSSLENSGQRVSNLRLEAGSPPLGIDRTLGEIGPFALYFYGN